jgi:tetratricopeptide (TPR) repeat protein
VIVGVVVAARVWYRSPEALVAQGHEALRQGQGERVRDVADRLERWGYVDQSRLLRAQWHWQQGQVAAALAWLNGITAEGPLRVEAALLAGKCLLAADNKPEAYRVFSWVIDQDDSQVDAHRGLAAVAYDLGQWSQAEYHLRRVAALDPDDPRPWRLLGLMSKDLSRWEAAEEAYKAALARATEQTLRTEIVLELAEVLVRRGHYAAAVEQLQPLCHLSPPQQVARAALLAEGLYGYGESAAARQVIEQVPPQQRNAALWRCWGRLERDEGHFAEAVVSLERALAVDPHDMEAWHLLAQTYAAVGRSEAAAAAQQRVEQLQQHWQRLTQLTQQAIAQPWDAAVRRELASVHEQLGQTSLAAMWRQAADVCAQQH